MDDELKSALTAYLQYRKEALSKTEGLFESYCEYVLGGQSGIEGAFREYRDVCGRYPKPEELFDSDGPVTDMIRAFHAKHGRLPNSPAELKSSENI